MAEVLLFHHAHGSDRGLRSLRGRAAAGRPHRAHARPLRGPHLRHTRRGRGATPRRSASARSSSAACARRTGCPNELVYAGFSLGVLPAQKLAQTRAGARGALLFYSCVPTSEFGTSWPADVPVQIHGMDADPIFVDEGDIDAARELVESAERRRAVPLPRRPALLRRLAACRATTRAPRRCSRSGCSPSSNAVTEALSQAGARSRACWEDDDRVPGQPEMTEFRRRLRYHQARWREANGHPDRVAADRTAPDGKPVASRREPPPARLRPRDRRELPHRRARSRRRGPERPSIEPHQSFDHQRLWADLLWSPAMAFNLFGDLAADLGLADRAVHAWWPDAPGTVSEVRFAHSPGRFDPAYLNSLRAFDAAFVLDLGDGTRGIVGVDVKYHEWAKPETPKPSNIWRYLEVAEQSGAFAPGAIDAVNGEVGALRDVARAPAPAVDAPARERHVGLGSLRRRPPRRQLGLRRGVRPLPGAARRPVDVLLDDPRGAPRRRRPADARRLQRFASGTSQADSAGCVPSP